MSKLPTISASLTLEEVDDLRMNLARLHNSHDLLRHGNKAHSIPPKDRFLPALYEYKNQHRANPDAHTFWDMMRKHNAKITGQAHTVADLSALRAEATLKRFTSYLQNLQALRLEHPTGDKGQIHGTFTHIREEADIALKATQHDLQYIARSCSAVPWQPQDYEGWKKAFNQAASTTEHFQKLSQKFESSNPIDDPFEGATMKLRPGYLSRMLREESNVILSLVIAQAKLSTLALQSVGTTQKLKKSERGEKIESFMLDMTDHFISAAEDNLEIALHLRRRAYQIEDSKNMHFRGYMPDLPHF